MPNSASLPPVIFLMGPTASGKTELALELCTHFPCDIVSVDSALVYRGLDIGSGKPSAEILAAFPHRLVDICEPTEIYSAARFSSDAMSEIAEIRARGRIPLLVGGTGLYFRALRHGLSPLPAADEAIRQRLLEEAESAGWEGLYQRLKTLDPAAAARLHPRDTQRLQRALEVIELTGQPMSEQWAKGSDDCLDGPVLTLILAPAQRKILHQAIAQRFQVMLDAGLVAEVEALRANPNLQPALPAVRAVGYRQVWGYLDGTWDHPTMVEKALAATRQLAKRQLTWLRGEAGARWFDCQDVQLHKAARVWLAARLG